MKNMAKCFNIIWKFTLLVTCLHASFHHPRARKNATTDIQMNSGIFQVFQAQKMFVKSFVSLRIFMVGCVTEWTNSLSTVYTVYMCVCVCVYLGSYSFESICVPRMHYKATSAGEPHTQTITIVFILWFAVSWHDRLKHWKLATGNCATENFRVFSFVFFFQI